MARRIPKRGFKNLFRTEYAVINLAELDKRFESGAVITEDELIADGIIKKPLAGVKVLGKGEITKSFTVKATAFSASAKEKIEKAGGKAELSWEAQPEAKCVTVVLFREGREGRERPPARRSRATASVPRAKAAPPRGEASVLFKHNDRVGNNVFGIYKFLEKQRCPA